MSCYAVENDTIPTWRGRLEGEFPEFRQFSISSQNTIRLSVSTNQGRDHLKMNHCHKTEAKCEDAELKRALQSVFV